MRKIISSLTVSCILAAGFSGAAHAADQRMVYEVYAGGIHAVQAEFLMNTKSKARYDMSLVARTRGLLEKLVPWEGSFSSKGWTLGKNKFTPELHQSTMNWREDTEIKNYNYKKDGTFVSLEVIENGKQKEEKPVEPEVYQDSTDALTAALEVLAHYNETGTCSGRSEVFDGKRRFAQEFKDQGEEFLTSSEYNIFEGKARACTVEVTPINGEWASKPRGWLSIQEQGRAKGTMPTVWIAQLEEGAPAVPVKIRVKTDYGTFFIHLSEYQNDTTKVVAQKRMEEQG